MPSRMTTLERAFQFAASGYCESLLQLREVLKAEGYDLRPLEGPTLRQQLKGLMEQARRRKSSEPQ